MPRKAPIIKPETLITSCRDFAGCVAEWRASSVQDLGCLAVFFHRHKQSLDRLYLKRPCAQAHNSETPDS